MTGAPRWDLTQLVDDASFEGVKKSIHGCLKEIDGFVESYRYRIESMDAVALKGLLEETDALALRMDGPVMFASLSFSADTSDEKARELNGRASTVLAKINRDLVFLQTDLSRLMEARPDIISAPELSEYRHYLERMRDVAKHMLSEREERVVLAKNRSGIESWSRLHNRWLASKRFPMTVDGETRKLRLGEMTPFISDPDREVRKSAYVSMGNVLAEDKTLWAEIMSAICADHREMMNLRKCPYVVSPSLDRNDISQGTLVALMRVARSNAKLCHKYFDLKAELLGLPRLGSWDLRAPLPGSPEISYSWDEARRLLVSVYSEYDPLFGEWAEDMYDSKRIDSEARKGKLAGAFCSVWENGRSAFIMSSYNGKLDDVYALAHELGHAVHAYSYTRAQVKTNYDVSKCMAECGSLFGELLLTDRLLKEAKTPLERRDALVHVLEGFTQTVFQEGFRFLFELSLYETLEEGRQLTADGIADLWSKAQRTIYGEGMDYLPESRYDWARFPQFFSAEGRFNNYPHVFAQLFAFALYRLYRVQGEAFKPKLRKMLEAGSSKSPVELVAELGFNIEKDAFWIKGMEQAKEYLDELRRLSYEI